jgi:hypothetical protein
VDRCGCSIRYEIKRGERMSATANMPVSITTHDRVETRPGVLGFDVGARPAATAEVF